MESKKVLFHNKNNRLKKVYCIWSLILNLIIGFIGFWPLMLGLFFITGGLSFEPATFQEILIGGSICLVTFIIAIVINLILYLVFRKKAILSWKWFTIPTTCIIIVGILFTIIMQL